MGLIMTVLRHLSTWKGFFTIPPAKSASGDHTPGEVDAFVHKCISTDAMGVIQHESGIGNMWVAVHQKKDDESATLNAMSAKAERQVRMGYLTPHVLAVLDTRLYTAVRGGVNTAFGKGKGIGISCNQPKAVLAYDAHLLERVRFHYQ